MIVIVPYQPTWPAEFQAIGAALRRALGDLALRIDHIGSTAVPDLAAKDIIDIQLTVAALDAPVDEALRSAGYRRLDHIHRDHIPPGQPDLDEEWSKWFFKPAPSPSSPAPRAVNLHVRVAGRANQRYPLLFRDYLRGHPAAALAYAQVKSELARHHADDIYAYCDIKDPVCDIIMAAAEAWTVQTRWQLGPSDC